MKVLRLLVAMLALAIASEGAFAVGAMSDVFAAVDLSTVSTFVGGIMVLVIGIALAYKAGYLGKRAIKAA